MILEIDDLKVNYGAVAALKGISLKVDKGQIVALIGANGAGKSTTLRAISGLAKVLSGKILYDGHDITNWPAHKIVSSGIAQSPEGRMIFANLTTRENLEIGAYPRKDKNEIQKDIQYVLSIFPKLQERIKQSAGKLSGGEQQMLAIGRAILARPKILLLDEPSLGIAPILVKTIFQNIVEINKELQTTILLVEQNAHMALSIANYAYVLETGEIRLEGAALELAKNEEVRKAYLGET
ncbi:leucine/isoleucine/valine transporter subunit; ATP-binding component of ABC superfamily [Candidatus Zixiibacteriota bacterium]|nr:leucine/isoleucine/valine transporter subunit; ATP-binding component of ABC superfamily [candidate division Zixibacteria bacterium]